MQHVMNVELSNASHPEYGATMIPFPIPDDAYENCLEQLKHLGVGEVTAQDCKVECVDSVLPSLRALEGTSVNVDELDSRYITRDELRCLTHEEVVLVRNEIYARYGYSFKSEKLRSYFQGKSWYVENPEVNSATFDTTMMNEIERENVNVILLYEKDMGWK